MHFILNLNLELRFSLLAGAPVFKLGDSLLKYSSEIALYNKYSVLFLQPIYPHFSRLIIFEFSSILFMYM